ncbi:glycosyltransferase family 4 protein [Patescibacteria group bacterium]|nr:glycosyltransferase family 4 protein [Patescibacteria group bacterium]
MVGKRKHLLIVCPFAMPNLGGVETHIEKLKNYAIKKGYYVTLLTYQPLTNNLRGDSLEKGSNFEIHRVSWFGVGLFPKLENYFPLVFLYLFPGLFVKTFLYLLKNHRTVDCIHSHGFIAATIVRVLNFFFKKRSVMSTHAVYGFNERPILKFVIRPILTGFDVILSVSKMSRSEIVSMGIPQSKVIIHPNWVDTDVFKPFDKARCKKTLGFSKKLNILFVGRFLEKKGVNMVIEVAKSMPDIGFHFVGSGPEEKAVRKLSNKLTNVTYYGVLMQYNKAQMEKLLSLYNACDYLVSPYLYDEGFSATLVESISCGLPVIITNRGSPPTFLSSEVGIYLSSDPSTEELITVLRNLTPDIELREKCRAFGVNNFGFKNAQIIIDTYE